MLLSSRVWSAAVAALLFTTVLGARADEVSPESEYARRLKVYQTIQPQGDSPFGEQINLYNGDLSFSQTDIVLEGIGPTISLVRSSTSGFKNDSHSLPFAFGNWELSVPRIESLTQMGYSPPGSETQPANPGLNWVNGPSNDPDRYKRCSQLQKPWFQNDIDLNGAGWNGIELVTSSGERKPLLIRDASNTLKPTMTNSQGNPIAFPGLTLDNWQVGCLMATSNGEEGEAFFVVSPDGTKYWIDYLTGERANSIHIIDGDGAHIRQGRMLARMFVSRVEDRFGNYLTYQYSGDKLVSITASDGRKVTIAWRSDSRVISSITAQPTSAEPRTWQYQYANVTAASATLTGVVLPDGNMWNFSLAGLGPGTWIHPLLSKCDTRNLPDTGTTTVTTITHPSGLVGKFTTTPIWHVRSYVVSSCREPIPPHEEFEPYEEEPPLYNVNSLIRREISGAGVPARIWTYGYSDYDGSTWKEPCALAGNCVDTKYVDVRDPLSNRTRYVYSNHVGETESKLLQTDFYQGESTLLRRETYAYAPSTFGPYPEKPGSALSGGGGIQLSRWTPLKTKTVLQQGQTFRWEAKSYDVYANPVKLTRYSDLAAPNSQSTYTEYSYNTSLWMVGQTLRVRDWDGLAAVPPAGALELSSVVYDPGTALPTSVAAYGSVKRTYAYYTDGTLKNLKDGLNNQFTFSGYKRGIAQRIDFPDGNHTSAIVDDFGQLTTVTDPLGNATGYAFDDIGRLTDVNLTAGWSDSHIDFAKVGASEYGIPANHWRRTVTKGNARSITYYDAHWRAILTYDYDTLNVAETARFIARAYDALGRVSFVSYPFSTAPTYGANGWPAALKGRRMTYDALARPLLVIQDSELAGSPLTTSYSYLAGFQTQMTDARLAVTTTSFQAFDSPSTEAPVLIQLPEAVTTTIVRDKFGKPLSVSRGGPHDGGSTSLVRSYVYDSRHRLCRVSEPETGNTVMTYDAADNIAWSATGIGAISGCGDTQVPSTARVMRSYDQMNRPTKIDYPVNTGDVTYTYDAAGNVASAIVQGVNASQDVVWTYGARNSLGLLTSEVLSVDGYSYGVSYTYDTQATLKTITYPDGRLLEYAPNALGQATKVGTYASNVQYFPDGDVSSYQYANGISFVAQKNVRTLPENLTYAKGATLLYSQDLAYDANANLTGVTDLVGSAPSRSKLMEYDSLNRLKKATATALWGVETYTYDALDNIRNITRGGVNNRFEYDALNRLTRIANAANNQTLHSYDYDDKGNMATRDGVALSFDEANRLLAYAGKGGYRYDAWGRRVKRGNGAGVPQNYYLYSQAGQMLFEHDLGTNKLTDYVYLDGKLVAKIAADAPVPALQVAEVSYSADYTVSWTAISGSTSYELEESTNGGANWSQVYSGASLAWNASGKSHGAQYSYRVRACASTCGLWSVAVTVTVDLRPQAAPVLTSPAYSAGPDYTVSWTSVAGAASYELKQGSTVVYSGPALSKAVTGQPSGTYFYQARGCNTYGCGPYSNTASTIVDLPPATVPTLSAPAASNNGTYAVSWTSSAGATKYTLEQSFNGAAYTVAQDTAALSWNASGKPAGSYAYRVKACNPDGCSAYSAVKTVVVTYPPASAPTLSAPASNITGSYTVPWTAVATATSYTLERNLNGGTWASAYSGSATSVAQSVSVDGNYNYRVRACNVGGCGPWSATDTTVVQITPAMPVSLKVVVTVDNVVRPPLVEWDASWPASPGATRYDLQIQNDTLDPYVTNVGNVTSYHLEGRGTRTFWVRACKGTSNCSAWRSTTQIINQ